METPEEIDARFDARAPHYDESAMHRELAAAVADFVDLGGVTELLDVGTGTGLLLRALPAGPARLTGVDRSAGMLAVARGALPGARFEQADAARLPFDDDAFDVVACVTALHLFADAEAALREWRRVLRPDGRIVTASFAAPEGADAASARPHGHTPPERHRPFGSAEALGRFGAAAGLELARLSEWRFPGTGAEEPGTEERCLIAEFAPAG